jgi:signal transduction histidine kinase
MIPKSVKWRLPLSYAAIAMLATLSLGVVLLLTLRGYYAQRERVYLDSNAQAVSAVAASLIEEEAPPEVFQLQLNNLSFLSQTRIRLLDVEGRSLAESDEPGASRVSLGAVPVREPLPDGTEPDLRSFIVVLDGPDYVLAAERETLPLPAPFEVGTVSSSDGRGIFIERTMSVVGTPYGFGLNVDTSSDDRRSQEVARQPLQDADRNLVGFVELSEGPAYGNEIVSSVACGWALAGGVAVLLAAGVGWGASRRISAPLLALTDVTTRMAGGNLSARADVTRRDEFGALAHSFNHMADQVEETVVTLRRFVSDAAHEIHTPLTALRTNLELAPDDEFVRRAQDQVRRLEMLTEGLLNLSHVEASERAAAHAPVALVSLVQEVGELYASRAEQAGLTFDLTVLETSVTVQGDEAQLRRALGNLLDNAIKFTPGGGEVCVTLRQEGGWAELQVEDSGIGVPEDDLSHLFSRFHRGRNAAAYPGSGLGLAIVKAIAEAHGGQVRAENVDQGAQFTLRLPVVGQVVAQRSEQ